MPSRQCPICKQNIKSELYKAHRQQHKNQKALAQGTQRETTEWARIRRAVRKRDGDKCRVCGRTAEQLKQLGLRLHVHHLVPGNDQMGALVLVCEDHHDRGGEQPYGVGWPD